MMEPDSTTRALWVRGLSISVPFWLVGAISALSGEWAWAAIFAYAGVLGFGRCLKEGAHWRWYRFCLVVLWLPLFVGVTISLLRDVHEPALDLVVLLIGVATGVRWSVLAIREWRKVRAGT